MRESAECKNPNPVIIINGVNSLPNFCNIKFVRCISLKENQMKLDTLRDGH